MKYTINTQPKPSNVTLEEPAPSHERVIDKTAMLYLVGIAAGAAIVAHGASEHNRAEEFGGAILGLGSALNLADRSRDRIASNHERQSIASASPTGIEPARQSVVITKHHPKQ